MYSLLCCSICTVFPPLTAAPMHHSRAYFSLPCSKYISSWAAFFSHLWYHIVFFRHTLLWRNSSISHHTWQKRIPGYAAFLRINNNICAIQCRAFNAAYSNIVQHTTQQLQSTLIISNSLISNNRLSRSENLVPVLTQRSTNRQPNIVEKRRNCSLGAISPLFHNIFNTSLTWQSN